MATRTIGTKLVMEGEAEYRASLSRISKELGTLDSALKLVESQYKSNANSMEALKAKGEALNQLYQKQKDKLDVLKQGLDSAKTAQETFASEAAQARQKVEAAEKALSALGEEADQSKRKQTLLNKALEEARKELARVEKNQRTAADAAETYQKRVNLATVELNELGEELNQNQEYLAEAEKSANRCAASIDQFGKEVKSAGENAEQAGNGIQKTTDEFQSFVDLMMASGARDAVKKIGQAFAECAEASIAFESAMTGVFKTVDGTEGQLQALSDGVKELATRIPSTTTEIAAVAEAAGQLGIATENVMGFTEVMINLGNATNLSAEEAATSLAKFANITQMSADDYERLGSTVVDLGRCSCPAA